MSHSSLSRAAGLLLATALMLGAATAIQAHHSFAAQYDSNKPVTITGIGFIRRKETDRIGAVVAELARCGIEATEDDDGFTIRPGRPAPATVRTYDDHRMAMSFALLGLRAPGIEIADPGCVAKTFPTFWDVFETLGSGGNA